MSSCDKLGVSPRMIGVITSKAASSAVRIHPLLQAHGPRFSRPNTAIPFFWHLWLNKYCVVTSGNNHDGCGKMAVSIAWDKLFKAIRENMLF